MLGICETASFGRSTLESMLICPALIGHMPCNPASQGLMVSVYALIPYAQTIRLIVTLPVIVETPTISNASEALDGVKVTSKRVAEKDEFAKHVERELVWSNSSAAEKGRNAASAAMRRVKGDVVRRIMCIVSYQ